MLSSFQQIYPSIADMNFFIFSFIFIFNKSTFNSSFFSFTSSNCCFKLCHFIIDSSSANPFSSVNLPCFINFEMCAFETFNFRANSIFLTDSQHFFKIAFRSLFRFVFCFNRLIYLCEYSQKIHFISKNI